MTTQTPPPPAVSITRVKEANKPTAFRDVVKTEPITSPEQKEEVLTAPVISIPEATKDDINGAETPSPGNCFDMMKRLDSETASTKQSSTNNNSSNAVTSERNIFTPVNNIVSAESVHKPELSVKEKTNDRLIVRIPLNLVKLKGKRRIVDEDSPPTAEDLEIDILGDDSPLKRKAPHSGHSASTSSTRKIARIVSSDNDSGGESEENDTTSKKRLVVKIDLSKLNRVPKVLFKF